MLRVGGELGQRYAPSALGLTARYFSFALRFDRGWLWICGDGKNCHLIFYFEKRLSVFALSKLMKW